MGVMRKLTGLLMNDLSSAEKQEQVVLEFRKLKIRLAEPKTHKDTLWERWENSRFGRPEWIKIFDNIDKLLALLLCDLKEEVSRRRKEGKTERECVCD
jgi:hypothetical protein